MFEGGHAGTDQHRCRVEDPHRAVPRANPEHRIGTVGYGGDPSRIDAGSVVTVGSGQDYDLAALAVGGRQHLDVRLRDHAPTPAGEVGGEDYRFVDPTEFQLMVNQESCSNTPRFSTTTMEPQRAGRGCTEAGA